MYQPKIEAMPRELKDALLGKGDFETINDIMSFEDVNSSEDIINQIQEALFGIDLPDYWIVTFANDANCELFYLVFETKLTNEEEQKLFIALPHELAEYLGKESLSDEYGIY